MRKDLQKKVGMPQTGKKPGAMEAGAPMTGKQKSFAALAPPADKITFADKIAGAKKEVDEMLGDVAAEAIKGALSGGQKKLDRNQNGKLDATNIDEVNDISEADAVNHITQCAAKGHRERDAIG